LGAEGGTMTPGPTYPHPIGARVAVVDCHGGNRVEGVVIGTPGPWTISVDTGRAVYLAAVGLVVERLDVGASEISEASREVEKVAASTPAVDRRGQFSLF
jgi:hypothetical protein